VVGEGFGDIDMLDDFVDGALANARAGVIVPSLKRLLGHARREGWVVVFPTTRTRGATLS
jgi:nicotinamidase-related amidase